MGQIERSVNAEGITVFSVTGEVDAAEILDVLVPFLSESPTQLVLWDYREGSLQNMTSADLRRIVQRGAPLSESRQGGRTAILCNEDVDFGLSRMFQAFAELHPLPFEIRVFRDAADAYAWLKTEP
jgi:hypothetical protein